MKQLRLSKSIIGEEEIEAVKEVLSRDFLFLGMGVDVQKFERQLSNFLDNSVVCVVNGTAALQIALQAAGIKNGDEVLVQSLTFLASYQAISATGAIPVSCEINPDDFTIDLRDAENKISGKTKAIMPVHYAGWCGDIDKIYKFATTYNLRVIEDAAHAFGTTFKGKKIGSFGDIICFSFDGIKNITSGEGGAIVTSDSDVINRAKDLRLLGVIKDTDKRYNNQRSWEFDVLEQGWRYHMSNIMAAIGLIQLNKFEYFKKRRQELASLYHSLLINNKKVKLLSHDYNQVVPHIFIIRINEHIRDNVKRDLENNGIATGLHYKPNHLLSFYKNIRSDQLPVTEKIYREIITLPLHPEIQEDDVKYICDKLNEILSRH